MGKNDTQWPEWMKQGVRVVRGPDWSAVVRDPKSVDLGTLSYVPMNPGMGDDRVNVVWDSGLERSYSSGTNGQYVLRAYDIQHVGIKHNNIKCEKCNMDPLLGIRYNCPSCKIDLCTECYMGDYHDLQHCFVRINTPSSEQVSLPPREGSRKLKLMGLFKDSHVIRGPHWNYPNKDGGDTNSGTVKAFLSKKDGVAKGWVRVKWDVGSAIEEYRFGAGGYVDVVAVKASCGGNVYIEHIPLIGIMKIRNSDKVTVNMELKDFKALQDKHAPGGWNDEMKKCIGVTGTVLESVYQGKMFRVQYEDGTEFIILKDALYRKTGFYKGCPLIIIDDKKKLMKLQEGHGGYSKNMDKILGKLGRVILVLEDGDLKVFVEEMTFTVNPTSCSPIDDKNMINQAPRLPESEEEEDDDSDGPDGDCVPGRGCVVDSAEYTKEENKEFKEFSSNMRQLHGNLMKIQDLSNLGNAMFDAFQQADLEKVISMIKEHGGRLLEHKVEGRTILHMACLEGYRDLAVFLINVGADVSESDTSGDTPLHYAAFGKKAELVQLLLEQGADPNFQNKTGLTPLIIAVNHPDLESVHCLLQNNANVNLKNSDGDTAMHDAVEMEQGQTKLTEYLLEPQTADFTIENGKNFNVLHWAVIKNNLAAVKIILNKNPSIVNMALMGGYTSLHIAAANGFVEICGSILEGSADPNAKDDEQKTPLHLAVAEAHKRVIEVLVDKHADVNAQDCNGDTPLHIAQNTKVVGQDMTKSKRQVNTMNLQIVYYLLEKGADITVKNSDNQTALDLVVDPNIRAMIERLTEAYHAKPKKSQGGVRLPIHWSTSKPITEVDIITLDTNDAPQKQEYDEVLKHFSSTLPNVEIISVKRVQNAMLWEHYTLMKRKMETKYGQGCANELHLYHGTKAELVDIITEQNFDFRIAGSRVGALYGDGSYFATTAKYSDLYASGDDNNHKVMFVAKVLAGKVCLGEAGLKRPKLVDPNDPRKGMFDSVVNSVMNPTIYCVFDMNQYYPEYLVEYV